MRRVWKTKAWRNERSAFAGRDWPTHRGGTRPAIITHVAGLISIVAILAVLFRTSAATAQVGLELIQVDTPTFVGDTARVQLIARSESGTDETISAMNVILTWDPAFIDLLGVDDTGGIDLLSSGFPGDPFGLNDDTHDGDAMYVALGPLGNPVTIPPSGALITTFEFNALALTAGTLVDIPATGGSGGQTQVFDGEIAGLVITGTLTGTSVIIGETCPPDLNHDLDVGFDDLVILLANWGPCPGGGDPCPADFDDNADVGFSDLIMLLAWWGACPP